MRASWRRTFAVVGVAAMLEACAFPSGTTYAPGETGTAMRVESAQVISLREVLISGLENKQAAGWGTVVGATLAGAAAYGLTEADNPAGVAVTIIAAVVGGLAGLVAEERRQTRRGAEYILCDLGGERIAVMQSLGSGEEIHQPGTEGLGFGPTECGYDVLASGSHWRLRDYGGSDTGPWLLIVAAPIKRPYIWDLARSVSALRYCLRQGLHVYLLEWRAPSGSNGNAGLAEYAGQGIARPSPRPHGRWGCSPFSWDTRSAEHWRPSTGRWARRASKASCS